jgi:hypothetical protein
MIMIAPAILHGAISQKAVIFKLNIAFAINGDTETRF